MASRKPSLIVVPQQPASCPPDPEVLSKASRRTFSAAEKLRILNEADACTQPGPVAEELAQLRKENARLQARLAQAELIIDVQKKVAQLLGEMRPAPHL